MFGRTGPDRVWVRRSIRFLWKYIIFVYFTSDIISCTQISLIFFWMFGRTSPVVRKFPEVWFLWKIQHIRVLYMHNIISYTHISVIFLWMFGRTGMTVGEFAGVLDSVENTLFSCTLHLISSHVHRYILYSFGCSGEPVQTCVSSLKYDSFEKYSTFVYFTCIISSHIRIYLLFSFGCSGERVRPCVSSLGYRLLWKIHYLCVLYMQYHLKYKNISCFLLDVRAKQSSRAWVPWSIDSFEKYSTFVYFTCIILSHVHIFLLFSFGCPGKPV